MLDDFRLMYARANTKPGTSIPEPRRIDRPYEDRKPNTVGWRTFGLMLRGG